MNTISLVVASVVFGGVVTDGEQTKMASVKVEFRGQLRHGVVAIGGETTGTTMTANGTAWELELPPALQAFAAGHHKQDVVVAGALRRVQGTEKRVRWIVSVKSIAEWARADDQPARIDVEFRGKLRTGVVAIGGETTGTEISDDGITWDLDLSGNQALAKQVPHWHRKTIVARGQVITPKTTERADRVVIRVDDLRLADDE